MIQPVLKTYDVCIRTGTVIYRHTAYIGNEKFCAQEAIPSMRFQPGIPDPIHIDANLRRMVMKEIQSHLYKDPQ